MKLQKIKKLLKDPNTRKRIGAYMVSIPVLLWFWVLCDFNIFAVIFSILFLVSIILIFAAIIFGIILLFRDD